MKAISLWQPWASLWCSPAKVHETRHWSTSHRGWLLVHAAKRAIDKDIDDRLDEILDEHFGQHWGLELPRGCLIGRVNLVGCKRSEDMPHVFEDTDDYQCGDFSPGRFAWQRGEFELFAAPIPFRGSQGFFDVPDDLLSFDPPQPVNRQPSLFDAKAGTT